MKYIYEYMIYIGSEMTKHTFSAGKSLAQKFGVKYIETSPGNSDNTLFTVRLQKREKNEGFGYLAPGTIDSGL